MGISQQIGASSLIKAGVCTSSTRPASPYEGQQIYETDTDLIYIYNGSSWQQIAGSTAAGNSGLVYITSQTFSNVTSAPVNYCFTSAYDQYKIVYNVTSTTASSFVGLRFRTGTTNNTANYSYVGNTHYLSGGSGYSTIRAGQNGGYHVINYSNASGAVGGGTIDVFNPKQAMSTTAWWTGGINDTNTGWENLTASGIQLTNSQFDGFDIIAVSGGFAFSVVVTVYGVRK
jgi:hypothetical protein